MGRFNLLDEPWILVVDEKTGENMEVSLLEVFQNAHKYKKLAGEMQTQDFAMFRLLLAVLHTVFSRFDVDGNLLDYFEVDERSIQLEHVRDDEIEKYCEDVQKTWEQLWEMGGFPPIVTQYLETWREHFNLFDEKYPFYQVTKAEMGKRLASGKKASTISPKNMNRLISESNNKVALFSPKSEKKKNDISEAELARWIIMLQGYCGQSDKTKFSTGNYDVSKGWIYDLGGIYFEGENLFQSLMMNLMLERDSQEYNGKIQRPCWEMSGEEKIERSFLPVDNLAELYTNWSRALCMNPNETKLSVLEVEMVKMPNIDHQNEFLEPMTIWRYNKSGPNKNCYTPKKHPWNQSLWRSFGLVAMEKIGEENNRKPDIVDWYRNNRKLRDVQNMSIKAISMQDDGNATSWVPVNEIVDELNMSSFLMLDTGVNGWTVRINDIIEETKYAIEVIYKGFLRDIKEIRNYSNDGYVDKKLEEMYFVIDRPFREWLLSLDSQMEKDEAHGCWKSTLKRLLIQNAKCILEESSVKDLKGIKIENEKMPLKNTPIVYNIFIAKLKRN